MARRKLRVVKLPVEARATCLASLTKIFRALLDDDSITSYALVAWGPSGYVTSGFHVGNGSGVIPGAVPSFVHDRLLIDLAASEAANAEKASG